eukprot:TRINITY_DN8159_c2_g1_i1.p1 TRINITY_DN8159_c2_g1~~TRINITY_DN8159_c2_g1_i1.p1  ORF type:complete len:281 (-),score=63.11 TRINITY_DN8159_c2_g1_i1:134-976(-)
MGGDARAKDEDNYEFLIPFDTIVKKGALIKDIEDRKQALVEQCKGNNGLTLQEVIEHNDWLLQVERDLAKARSRIERDFRISYALSLKVREGKRKAQLGGRLDTLRAQCDVLNEGIHFLSDHSTWFQESGTYRDAVDYLDSRWGDDEEALAALDEAAALSGGTLLQGSPGENQAGHTRSAIPENVLRQVTTPTHHDLDGFLHGDACAGLADKKRKKRKKRKGAGPGHEDSADRGDNSEEEEDQEQATKEASETSQLAPELSWLKAQGSADGNYVKVWEPD